jgi:hypothetical protein
MRKAKAPPAAGSMPERLNVASAGYFGVLAIWQGCRIAVHATRSAYLLQYMGDDDKWRTDQKAPDARTLRYGLMYEPVLDEAARLLPDDPSDAVQGLRIGWLPVTMPQMKKCAAKVAKRMN